MEKSAFVFLEGERERRLVAAWKTLPPKHLDLDTTLTLWSVAAGVERSAARRNLPVFMSSGICGQHEDGIRWVDEMVEQVVFGLAVGKFGISK